MFPEFIRLSVRLFMGTVFCKNLFIGELQYFGITWIYGYDFQQFLRIYEWYFLQFEWYILDHI